MKKKIVMVMLAVSMMTATFTGCGGNQNESKEETNLTKNINDYKEIEWPTSDLAKLVPVPKSNIGSIIVEEEDGFIIDIANTSTEDYDAYVKGCIDNGFDVDYYKSDDSYMAEDQNGNSLSLSIDDNYVMNVALSKSSDTSNDDAEMSTDDINKAAKKLGDTLNNVKKSIDKSTDSSDTSNNEETETKNTSDENVDDNEIRADIKETIDSYESFMNEYVEFMKKYNDSDDTASMLADYSKMMTKYADYTQKIDDLSDKDLTTAENAYLLEVQSRVLVKINEIQ
nr:DUF6591 domain-containing protein [uncultured Mediterraneibacter sp.]